MKSASAIDSERALPEKRRVALLKLLGDEDPAVYRTIREKILATGSEAAEWLRPHALSRDPVMRRHVREILLHFDGQAADDEFLGFCLKQGEELNLEQGAFLLARTRYPGINTEAYGALLDSFAGELSHRLERRAKASRTLSEVNRYLFEELGFVGNQRDYYNPDNSYLNRVIDRRTGSPISLCLVYLLVARRLSLPVAGIGLPGHFICRYQSSSAEVYVDAFNKGQFLTKADCIQYLARGNFSPREDYLAPLSARRLLLRLCANLHQVYQELEKQDEALRLQRYMVALAR